MASCFVAVAAGVQGGGQVAVQAGFGAGEGAIHRAECHVELVGGSRIAAEEDRLAFDEALFQQNIASFTPDMLAEDLQAGR